jgi:uncharacterized protein YbbK (DUF523 family)
MDPRCPEVEIGLGVPRPTIRRERSPEGSVRLVMPSSGEDLTRRMNEFSEERVERLLRFDPCGYILKKIPPPAGWSA